MDNLSEYIELAAKNRYAFVCVIIIALAALYFNHRQKRYDTTAKVIKNVPEGKRADILKLEYPATPQKISGGHWLRERKAFYTLLATIALFILIAIIFALSEDSTEESGGRSTKIYDHRTDIEIIPAREHELLILVADFSAEDKYLFKEYVIGALRNQFNDFKDVRVESLDEYITHTSGGSKLARTEAKKYRASMIIWGWYRPEYKTVPLSINFEAISYERERDCQINFSAMTKASLQDLESFSLQASISTELSTISLFAAGFSHYLRGNPQDTIKKFSGVLPAALEDVPVSRSSILLLRGIAYKQINKLAEAKADLTAVALCCPTPLTYYHLGDLALREGNPALAKSSFSKALDSHPEFALAHLGLGMALNDLGLTKEAADNFKAAYDLDEEVVASYAKELTELSHNNPNMRQALDSTIAKQPNDIVSLYTRAHLHQKNGRAHLAIQDYLRIAQIKPTSAIPFYHIGHVQSRKAPSAAKHSFETAIQLNPRHLCSYINKAKIHHRTGNCTQAASEISRAIDFFPLDADLLQERSKFYQECGQLDDATEDLTEAIKLDPSSGALFHDRGQINTLRFRYIGALSDFLHARHLPPQCKELDHHIYLALMRLALIPGTTLIILATIVSSLRKAHTKKRRNSKQFGWSK